VKFLGAQPNAKVFVQIESARVLAIPSVMTTEGDMDGLPNVALEALSMGRPVVGSRISGIPELIVPGENGFLVEPGNAADLCEKLGFVLDDATLAAELGRRGRLRIQEDFDVKKNVRKVIEAIVSGGDEATSREHGV
jgi:glycosyltransferase involved in cell wall biosynthesis